MNNLLLEDSLLQPLITAFDTELSNTDNWRPGSFSQRINCGLLGSTELSAVILPIIRYPPILRRVRQILQCGRLQLSEVSFRLMLAYRGWGSINWHRDWNTPRQYAHCIVYLSDVDQGTHAFGLDRVPIHGPAGTIVVNDANDLHAAIIRSTRHQRKSLQLYYGIEGLPRISNYSYIPNDLEI